MQLPKLDKPPMVIRIISITAFFLSLLMGSIFIGGVVSRIWTLLLLVIGSAAAALSIVLIYHAASLSSAKNTLRLMDKCWTEQGSCREIAEFALMLHPIATENDLLLSLFSSVMAECYDETGIRVTRLEGRRLNARQQALLLLCKLRDRTMNGRAKEAAHLFAEQHLELDAAYEEQPVLFSFRPERDYADDALVWYTLAMCFSARLGKPDEAEHYRKMAELRISMHDDSMQDFLRRILAMDLQYAAGKPEGLHEQAVQMQKEITESGLTRGLQAELNRMLEQAPVYGEYLREKEGLTNRSDMSRLFERSLPT